MTCKLRLIVAVTALAMLLTASTVWAAPSLWGSTGLVTIPTADVVQRGQFNMAGFYIEDNFIFSVNAAPIQNLELGIGVHNSGDTLGYLNAKYRVVPESKEYPGVALGVTDAGDSWGGRSIYVVASKNLPEFGLRGHIGIKSLGDPIFAGVSKVLNTVSVKQPGQKSLALQTTVLAELNGDSPSLGLQLRITPNFVLHASYVDLNHGAIGLSYNGWF